MNYYSKKKNYDETCRNMYIEICGNMTNYAEIMFGTFYPSGHYLLHGGKIQGQKLPNTWGFLKMGDPQVTMGFNTKSWSFMTWMIWGTPILGNLHMNPHDIPWYSMAFNVMILASLLCKKDCGTGGPSLDSLKFGTILWLTLVRLEAIDLASCANGDNEGGGLWIFVRPRNGQIGPRVMAMLIVNTCKN